MKKRVRLTERDKVDIVHAYEVEMARAQDLATKYGVTRQGIYKLLGKAGVDTSKHQVPVSCTTCGTIITRTRGKMRKNNHHFCCADCWHAWLTAGPPYIAHRHSGRLARKIVAEHFALQEGHVVHHEDKNQYNNRLDNLRVFVCQGDHTRYHRGALIEPIWDGRYA